MSADSPRLTAATLDGPCRITVRLNRRVNVAEWPPSRFCLKTSEGEPVAISSVDACAPKHDQTTTFVLETPQPLDFVHHLFELWVEGAGSRLVSVRDVLQDPHRYGDAEVQLGYIYSPEAATFRLFAPTAAGVVVVVADEVSGDRGLATHEMHSVGKGLWEAVVPGNLNGRFYAYRLHGVGFNPRQELGDIYATCAQGLHPRTLIVDMRRTDPPGFRDHKYANPESAVDAVVYEMHVRDFSIAADSGVEHKGKYLGLAEANTVVARGAGSDSREAITKVPEQAISPLPASRSPLPGCSTGLDHLVELGITHVQLMPVYDFDNTEKPDGAYDWGYMPVYFNSPEGWYASSPAGPSRITELKQAIQAFHERGIGVIMDAVYNHTAKASPFERLVPHYYYRKTHADNFCNGSGCGNEFMSESPMARKFIIDSLKMWTQEYRIDGFRFDLMGLIDIETVRQARAELTKLRPDILLWGEPWTGGHTPLKPITDKAQIRGLGIASFNDDFRDAIKGDRDGGPAGFIQVGHRVDRIKKGLAGAINDFAVDPGDSLNYFECHDNLTSWDKLVQTCPDAGEAEVEQMARLAALLLFSAQGIVFLHAGQEFGRTKRGHHNSYNLPDAINQIDWKLKLRRRGLFDYYRGLVALRKAHPALRLRQRAEVEHRVWFGDVPSDKCIAHIIHSADVPGEPAQAIVLLYNGNRESVEFPLGPGVWSIHADATRANVDPLATVEHRITVPARAGAMLCR